MPNLFKNVKLIKKGGSQFILSGFCNMADNTLLVVRFYEGTIARAQTVAKVLDGQMFSLKDVELERGLYTVGIQECIDLKSKTLKPEEKLNIKVMAGDAYSIDISCEEVIMYGNRGVKILVQSNEKELGNKDIYYKIIKAGDLYKDIRYWIPMDGRAELEFFVSGVGVTELIFEGNPPSVYSINVHV